MRVTQTVSHLSFLLYIVLSQSFVRFGFWFFSRFIHGSFSFKAFLVSSFGVLFSPLSSYWFSFGFVSFTQGLSVLGHTWFLVSSLSLVLFLCKSCFSFGFGSFFRSCRVWVVQGCLARLFFVSGHFPKVQFAVSCQCHFVRQVRFQVFRSLHFGSCFSFCLL